MAKGKPPFLPPSHTMGDHGSRAHRGQTTHGFQLENSNSFDIKTSF